VIELGFGGCSWCRDITSERVLVGVVGVNFIRFFQVSRFGGFFEGGAWAWATV